LPALPKNQGAAKTYPRQGVQAKSTLMEKLNAGIRDTRAVQERLKAEQIPEGNVRRGGR
jgi:hypothetical protein